MREIVTEINTMFKYALIDYIEEEVDEKEEIKCSEINSRQNLNITSRVCEENSFVRKLQK